MSTREFAGRCALITGGATGMGLAIARRLARSGCHIVVGSLPEGTELPSSAYAAQPASAGFAAVEGELQSLGVKAIARALDVRNDQSVDNLVAEARKLTGAIDILVNAAGVSAQELMISHSEETWFSVIDINLTGAYRTVKRCFPGMVERKWGRIVNIASTAADVGFPGYAAYCASKSGLLGLTRCVALEGAEHGVTCNAVNPGSVGTEMMRLGSLRRIAQGGQGTTVDENFAQIAASMPQKRLIPVEEIAAAAVFLCTDEALGITGEAITVSGGALW
jgi:NAD(P)-dependent dehydrogenase (short-subunit alcohol dehydrogenase family)